MLSNEEILETDKKQFSAKEKVNLVNLFQDQVKLYPNNVAIKTFNEEITYRDLDAWSDTIAYRLRLLIGQEYAQIGLFMEHGMPMVAGILGVLKSGYTYVPLNVSYPKIWVNEIISDAEINHLLCSDLSKSMIEEQGSSLININELRHLKTEESTFLKTMINPESVAYILFTSGSTGKPKGVMQSHKNVIGHIRNYTNELNITSSDKLVQFASYSFDAGVIDTYSALLTGACLCPIKFEEHSLEAIHQFLNQERITIYHSTPTLFRMLFNHSSEDSLHPSVRSVVLGGEEVYDHDVDIFKENFGRHCIFMNLLGSTECSFTMRYKLKNEEETINKQSRVPVGSPVNGVEAILLDETGQVTKSEGELIYHSEYIALGYWHDLERTEAVFKIDLNHINKRIYHTGDLARKLPDGNFEFLGRKDKQIKIRGNRVEISHITAVLHQCSQVLDAVVLVKNNEKMEKCLMAYVKKATNTTLDTQELRVFLKDRVPDYMVPEYLVVLEELPINKHGKIDRVALEKMPLEINQGNIKKPTNLVEQKLLDIWSDVLKIPSEVIGVDASFFELGGHSLKAMQIIFEIQNEFKVSLSLRQFFYDPRIQSIAAQIHEMKRDTLYNEIHHVSPRKMYPLAHAQRRIYFASLLAKDAPIYNMSHAFSIKGALNIKKLKSSIIQLLNTHDALKLQCVEENGEPAFTIATLPNSDQLLEFTEMSGSSRQEIDKAVTMFSHKIFNLNESPLFKFYLLKIEENHFVFQFTIHHLIADAWSLGILVDELFRIYEQSDPLENEIAKANRPQINYQDYCLWDTDSLLESYREKKRIFWLNSLSGELQKLNFPSDFHPSVTRTFQGDIFEFFIEEKENLKLKEVCQKFNVTPFMVLISAFRLLLYKYTGASDIIIGSPAACRLTPSVNKIIGCFVNTLPLRNSVLSTDTFEEILKREKSISLEAYENQDYPVENIIKEKHLGREAHKQPLFDVVFSMQNTENHYLLSSANFSVENIEIRKYPVEKKYSKFDLMLTIIPEGSVLKGIIEYTTDLFVRKRIEQLAKNFTHLLSQVIKYPYKRVSNYQTVTERERKKLISASQTQRIPFPIDKTLIDLFNEKVFQHPSKIALVKGDLKYSYEDLNKCVNKLANYLLSLGIRKDHFVTILLPRSIDQIISILAVLKTGNAYVPLDPNHPDERIQWVHEDSGAQVLITHENLSERITTKAQKIILDKIDISHQSTLNPDIKCISSSLAYVIYTSGTTGKPKGVLIEHKNVVQILFHSPHPFSFSHHDVWVMFHSYCFDVSVWEMYGALLYGGKLILIEDFEAKDTQLFADLLEKNKVTILCQTPTAFQNISEIISDCERDLHSIRYIIFAGEALMPEKLKTWREKYPDTKLINMYGITETTIHATYKEIKEREISENISNVGKPLLTYTMYIVDKDYNLVPAGVPGELLVGGYGVARGYLNRDSLTQEKFIDNPICPGERVYRSGDIVKLLFNGEMEYLGRKDHQIKLRGFRIELSEIEQILLTHPAVSDIKVLLKESSHRGQFLCAYFVSKPPITTDELRSFSVEKLPFYMVPAHFVPLENFPMTVNGKIDTKSFPEPDYQTETTKKPANNDTEKFIADIWKQVLDMRDIGVEDNFFELGGDSIQAMKSVFLSKRKYSIADLFMHPVLQDLAKYIENEKDNLPHYLTNLSLLNESAKDTKIDGYIICVPYGGGESSDFRFLSNELSKINSKYQILAAELPGNGRKHQKMLPLNELAIQIVGEIKERYLSPHIKFFVYGHCVGSALAVAIAKTLEDNQLSVDKLFIGGIFFPKIDPDNPVLDPWEKSSDMEIIKTLKNIGLNNLNPDDRIIYYIIQNFRQDVRNYREFFYKFPNFSNTKAKKVFLIGSHDETTKGYETRHDIKDLNIVVLNGADHYFVKSRPQETAQKLSDLLN